MPATTPKQKIKQIEVFGKGHIEIILGGDTFDDANKTAMDYAKTTNKVFVHPFDDEKVIAGQGTIGIEILETYMAKIIMNFEFILIGIPYDTLNKIERIQIKLFLLKLRVVPNKNMISM